MTSPAKNILENIQIHHGGHICVRNRRSQNPQWDTAYSWELAGYKKTLKFLRNIVKHLILKREQARLLLWLEENIKGRQVSRDVKDAIQNELKLMKRDPHRLSEKAQERITALL